LQALKQLDSFFIASIASRSDPRSATMPAACATRYQIPLWRRLCMTLRWMIAARPC
jgi:hypothetical protein